MIRLKFDMSFLSNLTARLPFAKKQEAIEVFFALVVGMEKLTAVLWTIEDSKLKILEEATDFYTSEDDVIKVTDRLLDVVVGEKQVDPQKILFGVPDSWLLEENLKENYLRLLRKLVKELEVSPMAYVSRTNALVHFLEKLEGVPTTAVLIGLEEKHVTVTVVKASKLDGTKIIQKSSDLGVDIEKMLLSFTSVEVLPSKILIFGEDEQSLEKTKTQLLSFSWMSKLSFLHFPKIEMLEENIETTGVCFAGASEINTNVMYFREEKKKRVKQLSKFEEEEVKEVKKEKKEEPVLDSKDLGFVVGDVGSQAEKEPEIEEEETGNEVTENKLQLPSNLNLGFLRGIVPGRFGNLPIIVSIIIGVFLLLAAAYVFLLKADIKIFVEPKILENNTQVTADPNIKSINETDKKIPGQIVETEVTGSGSGNASGKKKVGDSAKGTIKIINNSDKSQDFSNGTIVTASGGLKFTLDLSVNIASTSATSESKSTKTATVTASEIGADSNLASGTRFTIAGSSGSEVAILSEGNFSGGTSKDVTVVSDSDQQKLLAQVASDLRKSAQQKLQEKLPDKKVLAEALFETIVKKSFNKNIGDQATNFNLSLIARYKGTAYDDKDLRTIVSKLVSTNIPEGFSQDLGDTETSADVSKLEKDGRVIFLARFKAKLIPILNTNSIKEKIKGKFADDAVSVIKGMANVLGAEIKLTPALPGPLRRLPLLVKNINIEVGFK